jgi:hypothetical protein
MAATAGTKRQHSATNGSNTEGQSKGNANKKARVEKSSDETKKGDKSTPYGPTPYKKSHDGKKPASQAGKDAPNASATDENGVLNGISTPYHNSYKGPQANFCV